MVSTVHAVARSTQRWNACGILIATWHICYCNMGTCCRSNNACLCMVCTPNTCCCTCSCRVWHCFGILHDPLNTARGISTPEMCLCCCLKALWQNNICGILDVDLNTAPYYVYCQATYNSYRNLLFERSHMCVSVFVAMQTPQTPHA